MIIAISIILNSLFVITNGHGETFPKVLLISLDGFRHDYFNLASAYGEKLKFFNEVFKKGVKARHFNNLFVTRTFPNHLSIISGCYEESHGIVDNEFFDPSFNETFSLKNINQSLQSKWFSAVEPIWVTNQKNKHKSGIVYWPGQSAPFLDTYYPDFNFGIYSDETPLNYKFDVMIQWLKNEQSTLGIMYHPHPDKEGHKYGPNSFAVFNAIYEIDKSLGYLLSKIDAAGLKDSLNVILVSDHGMTNISSTKRIIMNQYLRPEWFYTDRGLSYTMWAIWPRKDVNIATIVEALRSINHASVFLKKDIPKDWHYSNNRRIAPLIIVPDLGWVLVKDENTTVKYLGSHGYRANYSDMKGIFVAWGPNIISSNLSEIDVDAIDVFPLIAEILKFQYRPHINGSLSRIRWILREITNEASVFSSFIMVSVLALVCALAVCIMIACAHYQSKMVHLQRMGQTFTLKTGKFLRGRQDLDSKGFGSVRFTKNKKKSAKVAPSDTSFFLEGSSGNEGESVPIRTANVHKLAS